MCLISSVVKPFGIRLQSSAINLFLGWSIFSISIFKQVKSSAYCSGEYNSFPPFSYSSIFLIIASFAFFSLDFTFLVKLFFIMQTSLRKTKKEKSFSNMWIILILYVNRHFFLYTTSKYLFIYPTCYYISYYYQPNQTNR